MSWYTIDGKILEVIGLKDIDVKQHPERFFHNALRMDYSSAIRSENVRGQNFTAIPRYWFIDAWFHCERCGEEFCWAKEEQKYWFDELKLRTDSVPHVCPQCRRDIREQRDLRKRYDAEIAVTLKKSTPLDVKREMFDIIDGITKFSSDIPEAILRNRRILKKQLTNG